MPRLSAVIITRNEAANIDDCLSSIAFCDEVIIVDCGSDDTTVVQAEQRGARVIHHRWTDHGTQKNIALSHATGDWAFSIDADERVTQMLAAEMQKAIADGRYAGYEMPRSSTFCGRTMRHSGWYPDYTLRLFRRTQGQFSSDPVHTRIICSGPVGRLKNPLIHHPVVRLEDSLRRMDAYSSAGAEQLYAKGRRVWFATALVRGATAFLRTYILRAGFLDGREGFLLAVLNAEGTYYRYMKLWLMQKNGGSPTQVG